MPSEEEGALLAKMREEYKREELHGPKINFLHLNVFFFKTIVSFGKEAAPVEAKTFW